MKILGRMFQISAALWLLAFGLHHLALLLRALRFTVPPALRWFGRLRLPHDLFAWHANWPFLVGLGLAGLGTALIAWSKHRERKKKEGSEA